MPILRNVRQLRQARGVKVGRFAELVGCSRAHMTSVENGWRPASPELANRIAQVLTELGDGVDAAELLPAGSVPDEPPPQPKPAPKPKPKPKDKDNKGPKRSERGAA